MLAVGYVEFGCFVGLWCIRLFCDFVCFSCVGVLFLRLWFVSGVVCYLLEIDMLDVGLLCGVALMVCICFEESVECALVFSYA